MTTPTLPPNLRLESLEVGAAPVVQHFLERLGLRSLFDQHLPTLPGRAPALPSSTVLCLLLSNLLLARQPLYALAHWASRRVPEVLGLATGPTAWLNDDRVGRALDHLYRADRASLLTALVRHVVRAFTIALSELHQDTTTVTFCGAYADQAPAEQSDRPPRITFGYNKDHRPDLKQLLYSITISDDGAVPIHCKIYDGNTTDDQVHKDTWDFVRALKGNSDFLYVADSKLCTRENMSHIVSGKGRFLTVMPRSRAEDTWFRQHLQSQPLHWHEVHREANPRRREGPEILYHGVESPRRSSESYRVLWYRSSQKEEQDRNTRQHKLERVFTQLEAWRASGRDFETAAKALEAGHRLAQDEQAQDWLTITSEVKVEQEYQQIGPGRPGPKTEYRQVEHRRYQVVVREDAEAIRRAACSDGLFPLMTNDEALSLKEALLKYKYQPFVEKRHEQLKSVFGVAPMWLKSPRRVESLLWLYYVVELVGALVERELTLHMDEAGVDSLALYPEGRRSAAPTCALVFSVLEGYRRHRLLDSQNQELQRFYDELSEPARQTLELLGVARAPYGLD